MQVIQESCVQLVPVLLSHLKEKWLLKEMIATFTTIQHVPRFVIIAFLHKSKPTKAIGMILVVICSAFNLPHY